MLRKGGFEVAICPTGPDALEAFDSTGAGLVLPGLMLSGPAGNQVRQSLRQRPDMPVIMPTGTEAEKAAGLELGADDYVTKPFTWRELATRIQAVLRRREETGETPTATPEAAGAHRHGQTRGHHARQADQVPLKESGLAEVLMHTGHWTSGGWLPGMATGRHRATVDQPIINEMPRLPRARPVQVAAARSRGHTDQHHRHDHQRPDSRSGARAIATPTGKGGG